MVMLLEAPLAEQSEVVEAAPIPAAFLAALGATDPEPEALQLVEFKPNVSITAEVHDGMMASLAQLREQLDKVVLEQLMALASGASGVAVPAVKHTLPLSPENAKWGKSLFEHVFVPAPVPWHPTETPQAPAVPAWEPTEEDFLKAFVESGVEPVQEKMIERVVELAQPGPQAFLVTRMRGCALGALFWNAPDHARYGFNVAAWLATHGVSDDYRSGVATGFDSAHWNAVPSVLITPALERGFRVGRSVGRKVLGLFA